MFPEIAKGSLPAAIAFAIALWGTFYSRGSSVIVGGALALWLIISAIRLAQEVSKGTYKQATDSLEREPFDFWLGAFLSSLLAPPIYVLLASHLLRPR